MTQAGRRFGLGERNLPIRSAPPILMSENMWAWILKIRGNETIGYIVIETGTGMVDGVRYQAALGKDAVRGFGDSATPYAYPLTGLSSVSTAAISQSGMDGKEGSWAVLFGNPALSTKALKLYVAEDAFNNSLSKHTTEQVAYIVFE